MSSAALRSRRASVVLVLAFAAQLAALPGYTRAAMS
jgi:hypothetical protein